MKFHRYLQFLVLGGFLGLICPLRLWAQVDYRVLRSFAEPAPIGKSSAAPLVLDADGVFYGVTQNGGTLKDGSAGQGTVFRVNANGSNYRVLHSFDATEGSSPLAGLVLGDDGVLYGSTWIGGRFGQGSLFRIGRDGSGFALLKHFGDGAADGRQPTHALLQGKDGRLYGVTSLGGTFDKGTAFVLNKDGTGFSRLRNFGATAADGSQPSSPLVQNLDGTLYGATTEGGTGGLGAADGNGTVYRLKPDGTGYAVVYRFRGDGEEGRFPAGAIWLSSQGFLFGSTVEGGFYGTGTVYRIRTSGVEYKLLWSPTSGPHIDGSFEFETFSEGIFPAGGILGDGTGWLYSSTLNGVQGDGDGAVFRIREDGTKFQTIRRFGSTLADGLQSKSAVIKGPGGALFGTTLVGGNEGAGILYRIGSPTAASPQLSTVLQFSPTGVKPDGEQPAFPPTVLPDGTLLGVTPAGGETGNGTIYRQSADGRDYAVVRHFQVGVDGRAPSGPLVDGRDGYFYGVCEAGGANAGGTVFLVASDGSNYRTLQNFSAPDGTAPGGRLLVATNGAIYGVAREGAASVLGSVWRMNRDGSQFKVLRAFRGGVADGGKPTAGLIEGSDDRFYGVTTRGGAAQQGVVYSLRSDGTEYRVLASFGTGALTGVEPAGELIFAPDGRLYGVTLGSTGNGRGSVFRINVDGSGAETLHVFQGAADGAKPVGRLLQRGDGRLYGVAQEGGQFGRGSLFRMAPSGEDFSVLHHFFEQSVDGRNPLGGLSLSPDGSLHGSTSFGGTKDRGTLYRLTVAASIAVSIPLPAQTATYGLPFQFSFAPATFAYEPGLDRLQYFAEGLPAGLLLDAATRTFRGTPTAPGEYSVRLVATDAQNPSIVAETRFLLSVRLVEPVNLLAVPTGARVRVRFVPDLAGARWKLPWLTQWQTGGAIVSNVPAGSFGVDLLLPVGQRVETNLPLVITNEGLYEISRTLTPEAASAVGGLVVLLKRPDAAGDVEVPEGAWRLDQAGDFHPGGVEIPGLAVGRHVVEFRKTGELTSPEARQVDVLPNQTSVVTAYYTAPLSVCPSPALRPVRLDLLLTGQNPPYRLNGQLSSSVGFGSGVVVGERVVLTAAHVVHDRLARSPVGSVLWRQARMAPDLEPRPLEAKGWFVMSNYVASIETPDEGKFDVAALWFDEDVAGGSSSGYLVSLQQPSEWLAADVNKRLVGYPVEGGNCGIFPGVMHSIAADQYLLKPSPHPIYISEEFDGLPGNSGGPLYVQAPGGGQFPAAVYLGTQGGNGRVRVIDADVVSLIEKARAAARGETNFAGGGAVNFSYTPAAPSRDKQVLTVTLNLPAAVGAGWRIRGAARTNFLASGASTEVSLGTRMLEFAAVPGYELPTEVLLKVSAGADIRVVATYGAVGHGGVTLIIGAGPGGRGIEAAGPAGVRIRLQQRSDLSEGAWTSVGGPVTLGPVPMVLRDVEQLRLNPGFYRTISEP